ncbi:MAG: SDR family NAD(P)-dependent oxidoreductase, partial [Candidatus Limnocylindrales bacterium]
MDLGLAGRVALVAGSSRGIGLATARTFLSEGCRTAITGRDRVALQVAREALEAEFGPDRLLAFEGDLRQSDVGAAALAAVVDRWGRLDCLVANVGSGTGPVGWDVQEADWQQLLETNFLGSSRLVQQVLPHMIERRSGSIVLVASIVGLEGTDAPLPYSAAKAALINYSKNLARDVGRHEVRVNCVAPGNILFPGGSWERHLARRPDDVRRM